ncbi:uncharacterized protein [Paramormyrops kingsleyae]|uniref:uncharacterized protein isoform X2 n=1 Tax=Paramormyrops kingsleyae TaxID=1676925 RepID=UPI003B974B57
MADESAVKVCVRVRPLIQREQDSTEVTDLVPVHWKADKQAIHQVDEGCITKTFNFDRVFSAVETTKQLYQEIAKPLVVSTVQGYNGTIFAYGQTSSGKTFTMMGSSHMPGVIPLAMEDVFLTIKNCPKKEFLLRVSYMEIYNETVTDLLCDSWKRKPLEIREGNYKNVYVADLTEELVTSADQALAWIRKGEKNRHYGKTKMNQRSSRSHTIFRMILESRERSDPASGENADGAIIVSHLNLVDLAGAERASQTGAEGARLKEGCNINRSLFTLGQVIKKLSEESQGGFTNYRDSKLTRILQNSLGGNAKTVIICTITPATVDETLSTLQFASTAKRMKNDPHVTEVSDDGALLRRYRNEIVDLKRRLEEVSTVTRTAETEKEVLAQLLQEKDQLQREQEDRIKNLTNIIVTSTKFVAVKKVPKRRMTWGGKLLRPPLEAQSCANSELSFAEPSVKRRKAELQSLGEADEEGDDFDSRWDNLEQLGLDGDMNQSSITIRSFYEGEFSSPCLNELSEKVAGLELQLKTEALEKQVALETKAALESRLAELELKEQEKKASLDVSLTELEAEVQEKQEALETRTALEVRLAELEAEVQEKREAVETRTALEVRLAELEAEVQEKRETVETRAALEVRLAELEAEVQEKRETVETRAALEVRLAELEAEVQEKRETVETRAALEVRQAELEAEVQEKREAGETRAALEVRLAELEAEVQEKRDAVETRAALEVRLAELEAEVQEKRDAVETRAALEVRLAELEAEVQEKRETVETRAALEVRLAELEAEVQENRETVETRAALEVRLAELEAEVQEKRETVETRAALEVRLAELEAEVQEKRETVETRAALEVRLAELEAEVQEKRETVETRAALEVRLAELEAEVQEKRETVETRAAVEVRLAELEAEVQEKREAVETRAAVEVRLAELETEVQEKREAVETRAALEVRLAELEAEVQEKREAVETRAALEVRLAELEAEVQENRETVETRAALEVRLAELEAEVQEKREAMETRAAVEVRLAELEAEVQEKREAVETRAALEVRLAELEAEVQEKREAVEIKVAELQCQLDMSTQCLPKPSQEQYKKDLGETIQLCETLVSEKEAVEVQRDLAIQECLILKEENCTLSQDKERLLREVQEKQELEEFSALEQESTKQYETELKDEIASLQSAVQLSLTRAAELEVRAASLSAELKSKDERIAELQNLSGKDLVQQVERLSRSLSDAEAVSRDAKRDWAVLRSEKLGLQESVSALTESSEKLKVEVQTLRDQQGADKARFKKMETDLQRELQGAFEETAKLTVLLDGKVPRSMSLTDNIELERQVSRLKKELELAQEEVKGLSTFRELPVKVEQLMQQIGDLTQDLCSCQAEKEALVAAWEASDARVQKLIEDLQQAQDGLERAVGTEAELETLRADAQHWVQEKEQLLESVETLKQEVLQRQEGESSLKHKLAEQQRLVTDLQMILAESRETTNRNQQSFEQKSEQLQKKGHQLDEELEELKAERSQLRRDLEENAQQVQHRIEEFEELRFERDQLKSDLQENVEMMIENQEELRVAQEKIRDQQKCIQDLETRTGEMKSQLMHSLPNVEDLKGQIQQLGEELQLVRSERDSLLSERTDSAQGVEEKLEKLHSQVTSITQERDQLQEILEGVRAERNQLKKDLQENLEKAIKVQDDLKLQQIQSEEAQAQFQLQVQQQAEDLERLKSERGCLEDDLQKHVGKIQQLGEELQLVRSERDSLLSERTDSAQGLEEKLEKLHSQVTSITQERDQLQEMLEGVRAERNQLKNDVEENIEMLIMVQEELRQQQQLTSDLQAQKLQRETQQSPQQSEELDGWRAERNQLKRDLQENVEMMIENQEELRLAQEKIRDQQSTIKNLETQFVKMRSQLIDADAEGSSQNVTELKDPIQQLSEELQLVRSERDSLLSERTDSAQGVEEKLEKLHSQVTSITQERNQLQEILEGVREERNQLKNDIEENVMRIQQLGLELQVMQSERDSLLSERTDSAQEVEEKLEKLHSQVTSITQERDQLQEILQALREERNQLKKDLQENLEKAIKVQDDLKLQQIQSEAAQAQFQLQVQQQAEDLERLKSERGCLEDDLQKHVGKIQQLGEELQLVRSERDSLLSERTDSAQGLEEKLEKLHSQVTSITQERDQLQEMLEGVRAERNQLKNDIEENVVRIQQLGVELQVMQSERDTLLSERSKTAQGVEEKLEKLHSQMTSITQERDQLQEILKALREERNQLKNDLQENLEKVLKFQDELQHQKTLKEAHTELQLQVKRQSVELDALREKRTHLKCDLQKSVEAAEEELQQQKSQSEDAQTILHLKVKQLGEELEGEREEVRRFKKKLDEASAKLLPEASQSRSVAEESRRLLYGKLEESERLLQDLLDRCQLLREQALGASTELMAQLDESSLVQNELVFRTLPSIPKATRQIYRNVRKNTDDFSGFVCQTARVYAHLATVHRQQFEAQAHHDLACMEEMRLQDLLLQRAQGQRTIQGQTVLQLQDLWDQRASELLEKRQSCIQKLQSILGELESGLAQNSASVPPELAEQRCTNEELRPLCDGPSLDPAALEGLLQRELSRQAAAVQPRKELYQRLQAEYFQADSRLQVFKATAQRQLMDHRGRSLALLQSTQTDHEGAQTDGSGSLLNDPQLVIQLQKAEQMVMVLQTRLKPLEKSHVAACDKASKLAQNVLLLKQQLQEVQTQLEERQKAVESLKKQLEAQVRKGVAPGTEELEEMKAKLFRMELEQSAQASSCQEKVATMTALLDHKEDTLRKLKEMLRKAQNQGDESFIAGGPAIARVSSGAGAARLVQSTVQVERAKLESDMKHLEQEVERLESLVSSQKEEIGKWRGRAVRLKETQRDLQKHERPSPAPLTPSKRGQLAAADAPSPMKKPADRSGLPGHEDGSSKAPPSDESDPESDLPTALPPPSPDPSPQMGPGSTTEDKCKEWWPMSPSQADNCKAQ